jgi:mRNA interferase MazF
VIQNDTTNRYAETTMVAPITSTVRLPLSPLHVLLPPGPSTGLSVAAVAVLNQIRTVDRRRLIKKLGEVSPAILARTDEALKVAFGLTPSDLDDRPEPKTTVTRAISRSTGELMTGRYED